MTTFKLKIDPRRKAQLRLLGDVHTQIANAFEERKQENGLTRREVADKLGWDKAALTRKLKASANITLETLADLGFALDREVLVFFVRPRYSQAVRHCVEGICQWWIQDNRSHDVGKSAFLREQLLSLRGFKPCARAGCAEVRADINAAHRAVIDYQTALRLTAADTIFSGLFHQAQASGTEAAAGMTWHTLPDGTIPAVRGQEHSKWAGR